VGGFQHHFHGLLAGLSKMNRMAMDKHLISGSQNHATTRQPHPWKAAITVFLEKQVKLRADITNWNY